MGASFVSRFLSLRGHRGCLSTRLRSSRHLQLPQIQGTGPSCPERRRAEIGRSGGKDSTFPSVGMGKLFCGEVEPCFDLIFNLIFHSVQRQQALTLGVFLHQLLWFFKSILLASASAL